MKNGRYVLTGLVISLLVSVSVVPNFTVGTDSDEKTPPVEETIGVECLLVLDGEAYETNQRISLEDALVLRDLFIKAAVAFKIMSLFLPQDDDTGLNGFMDDNTPSTTYFRETLINTTENRVSDLSNMLTTTGILPPSVSGLSLLSLGLLPGTGVDVLTPVLSMGVGYGYIPNYNGEAIFGFMLRPIFLTYLLGYTGSINFVLLPPRVAFWDKFGPHAMSIWGFAGMYIKFGELGTGVFPIQVIMGESLLLTKGVSQTMTGNMGQSVMEWFVGILLQRYIQNNFLNLFNG